MNIGTSSIGAAPLSNSPWLRRIPPGDASRDLSDQKAALVADVATGLDPNGSLAALEEGVGQPTTIYVVLPDSPWRVAAGAVYSYYEFTVQPADRMTDETWQAQVEAGTNPPQPDWTTYVHRA